MKKIATPTAVNGEFVDGNREIGQKATQFSAEWCNDIQNEIWNLIRGLKGSDPTGESQDEALKAVNRHVVEYLTQENLTSAKIFEVLEAGKLPVLQIGGGGASGYTKMYAYPVSFYKVTEGTDAGYRRAVFFRYSRDVDNNAESNKLYWYKYVNIPVAGQGESYANGTVDLDFLDAIADLVITKKVASVSNSQGAYDFYELTNEYINLNFSFATQGGRVDKSFYVRKYESGDVHRYDMYIDGNFDLSKGAIQISGNPETVNTNKLKIDNSGLHFTDSGNNRIADIEPITMSLSDFVELENNDNWTQASNWSYKGQSKRLFNNSADVVEKNYYPAKLNNGAWQAASNVEKIKLAPYSFVTVYYSGITKTISDGSSSVDVACVIIEGGMPKEYA